MKARSLAVAMAMLCVGNLLAQQEGAKPFKDDELAALLAPIALYPDNVLTQILMASTYPLEVVAAHRWVQANASLKGDALAKEAEKQGWDASVSGLTALPDVLKSMDAKLDWTQKVGDAFLGQQKEVMAMIQTLRQKAKKEGNLESSEQLKVTSEPAPAPAATATTASAPAPQVIVIESTSPQTVYVPTYPPTVYGSWGYPAYPPYTMPPPPGYPGSGFWLGVGVTVAVWNNNWNSYPNWHGGNVYVNNININGGNRNNINNINGGGAWQHNPAHRRGTSYRDNTTATKYNRGANNGAASRESYRGRDAAPTASTRDAGANTRNTNTAAPRNSGATAGTTNRASSPSPSSTSRSSSSSSSAFGGMSSGSSASSFSSRGGASRSGGGGGRRR
jgi:uncharacterized membrane protein YgcG